MYPILLQFGNFRITSYNFFYLLGGMIGGVIGWKLMSGWGVPPRRRALYLAVLFPLSFLAGLLNGVLFNPAFYTGLQEGELVLRGGIVSHGVVLIAFVVTAFYARVYHTPPGRDLDGVALVLPVMLAIFRIGCFLNGCCYGRTTEGFGGLYLPDAYQVWAVRYPTQLLLLALDLVLAGGLWLTRKRSPQPGSLAIAFIFWFGLGRLAIDSLRNLTPVVGPFSLHMLADLAFLLVGAGSWLNAHKKSPIVRKCRWW